MPRPLLALGASAASAPRGQGRWPVELADARVHAPQDGFPIDFYRGHLGMGRRGRLNNPTALNSQSTTNKITTTLMMVLIGGAIGTYWLSKYKATPTITNTTTIWIRTVMVSPPPQVLHRSNLASAKINSTATA